MIAVKPKFDREGSALDLLRLSRNESPPRCTELMIRTFRKGIFWLHLVAGLLAGVVILVMSVTGVLLTYERQVIEWADGYSVSGESFQLEEFLHAKAVGVNELPTAISVERDASRPVALHYGRAKTEFYDPANGKLLGEGHLGVRKFFRTMLMWHRWLGREGADQPWGRAVIGAGNLVFLFLVVSGIFLWIPRRWSRRSFAAVSLFQRRLKGKARDWNWHHVLGLWAALPLLLIVVSGVVMSYPWANDLVYRLAGEPAPEGRRRGGGDAQALRTARGIDEAFTTVKRVFPDWQTIQLQLPPKREAQFTVMNSHRGRPDQRVQVAVDLATQTISMKEGLSSQSKGRQARTWIRWIHTGEAGGWLGQTIAGLASAAACVLVWTGFALSWRRFISRRKKTN